MSSPASDLQSLRRRTERRFEAWAGFVAARPITILLAAIGLVAALAPQARFIEADTHPEEFLRESHPVRRAYAGFKDQFGSDSFVLVTVESESLFSLDFLAWLRGVHEDLEERVPHVAEVTSLVNVRSTRGVGDELVVEDLLERWPESTRDAERIREIARATPFYQRSVIGDDERHTAIIVELEPWLAAVSEDALLEGFSDGGDDEIDSASSDRTAARTKLSGRHEAATVDAIQAILVEHERPDIDVQMTGLPVLNLRIVESMEVNIGLFLSLSIVAISIVLALLLKRVAGVLLPLILVFATLLSTLGAIGLRGEPVNMTIQILPSFLLAVGAGASVHVLVIFFQHYDAGGSRAESLRAALGHAGLPVTMACATTAAGLASFLGTNLVTVRDIGILAPIGILLVLLFALTLLPAMLCLIPLARRTPETATRPSPIASAIVRAGDWSVRHPGTVLTTATFAIIASLIGTRLISFDQNALTFIDRDDPFHLHSEIADGVMGGSQTIELVIDTGRVNGLYEPGFQQRLEEFQRELDGIDPEHGLVRKTLSVNDVLREINQALNENRPDFFTTPDDRDLIAQELLLFENSGSDDLEDLVDSQLQTARLSIQSIWGGALFYAPRIDAIDRAASQAFPEADVQITGITAILNASLLETQRGMVRSYTLALLTITPMMMLLVGTLRGGLASMVPNLTPVIIVIGGMGWLGLALDSFGMMTGSIAIGLAVDDTIHFFHTFYREFGRTGDTRASVRHTLQTTGRALLTTSIVLSIGFLVFVFSTIPSVALFGAVTSSAIVLAFLADVLIAPALVGLATRNRQAPGVSPLY